MITAAERLVQLAGRSGTAAALLISVAAGATTGEALVRYSELPSGTAAEHILVDHVSAAAGRAKRTKIVAVSAPEVSFECSSASRIQFPSTSVFCTAPPSTGRLTPVWKVTAPTTTCRTVSVGEECGSAFRVVAPSGAAKPGFVVSSVSARWTVAVPVCCAVTSPAVSISYALTGVVAPSTIQNPTPEMLAMLW